MNNVAVAKSGLFAKVSLLISAALGVTALGAYVGSGITSVAAFIGLAILFFAGAFVTRLAVRFSPAAGITCLVGWSFVSGLFLGPTLAHYVSVLGKDIVFMTFLGSAGVMAGCGAIGALSGRDFTNLGRWLLFALLALIVVGIVNIFVSFGQLGTMLFAGIGMLIFAGFFIVDFFRLAQAADTWADAVDLTMDLYLDYINFVLYALRFIEAYLGRSRD